MPIILTRANEAMLTNSELRKQLRAKMEEMQLSLEGAHLMVERQIKKPVKKSQYISDMLTLPED